MDRQVHAIAFANGGSSAIAASSIGLYFRIPESVNSDLTWNEPPASGMA